ncbi:hypothetical protein EIP91_011086 [Steccherinum ochraceum]|uniref:Uncharacterized protein n=1 Tax=Steccherinum ochraceum TaxID=92696 RepID=A0A4R0RWQ1_9APHY|nr:hypothetical protein EIP91_011086 [Steccherinum ochraceum]
MAERNVDQLDALERALALALDTGPPGSRLPLVSRTAYAMPSETAKSQIAKIPIGENRIGQAIKMRRRDVRVLLPFRRQWVCVRMAVAATVDGKRPPSKLEAGSLSRTAAASLPPSHVPPSDLPSPRAPHSPPNRAIRPSSPSLPAAYMDTPSSLSGPPRWLGYRSASPLSLHLGLYVQRLLHGTSPAHSITDSPMYTLSLFVDDRQILLRPRYRSLIFNLTGLVLILVAVSSQISGVSKPRIQNAVASAVSSAGLQLDWHGRTSLLCP